jgi:hypothetical protein
LGESRNEEKVLELLLENDQFLETFYPEIDHDKNGEHGGESDAELSRPIKFYTHPAEDPVQVYCLFHFLYAGYYSWLS